MNIEEIRTFRQNLKSVGRVETNAFSDDVFMNVEDVFSNESSCLISCLDNGTRRLYFYTTDIYSLKELFPLLQQGEYTLEVLSRNPEEKKDFLVQNGFTLLAQLMRMSVRDCSHFLTDSSLLQYADDGIGLIPNVNLASAINRQLSTVFDTRVSHLQSDDDMRKSIERGEMEIHQADNGSIDAILQVVVKPQNFYINQIYNGTEKNVIHAMLQKRLKQYIDQGGKYAYAWIEKNNVASIKFHEKYGLKPDGLWNMVYLFHKD